MIRRTESRPSCPAFSRRFYPDSPRGFVFPGDPGVPRTLAPTQYNRFAPRLGIAYSPGPLRDWQERSSAARGRPVSGWAAGSTTLPSKIRASLLKSAMRLSDCFTSVRFRFTSRNPTNRTTPPSPVGNRFPFTIPPAGATGIWPIYLPVSGSPTFRLNNKLPYAEHFNLTIQREIAKTAVFSIGFVASRGRHLFSQIEANPGSASKCLAVAPPLIPSGQECGPFGEDSIYNLSDGSVVNGTRPFSVTSGRELANGQLDFSSNSWEATVANSNYNSLQTSLEKKVGDLRFLAPYLVQVPG